MYDFKNNKKISKEDVKIMLSYVPFQKYATQDLSPVNKKKRAHLQTSKIQTDNSKNLTTNQKEGLYENEEGKDKDFIDRVTDMEEIE